MCLSGLPAFADKLSGTRMEFALAELAIEEPQEPEEDIEFVVDKGMYFSLPCMTPF